MRSKERKEEQEGDFKVKKIGLLTAGGDAPGMNAGIRAVVRTSLGRNMEVTGIRRGYRGLIEEDFFNMDSRSVSGIINQGGTILKSVRFPEFQERDVQAKAFDNLRKNNLDGLVVMGGDGSARGAYALFSEFNFPVVVIPASIDNDLYGTDITVGFDTAVNTAVEAIDRIRDTATSHNRTFIIEVMGRDCGNIALEVGVACGAEIILIPEIPIDWKKVFAEIEEDDRKGKMSSLIVLAEGAGKANELANVLGEHFPEREVRFSILGYIQRGGRPTYATRVLATKFGVEAVQMLETGFFGYMVGIQAGKMVRVPLKEVTTRKNFSSLKNLEITNLMAI